MDVQKRHLEMIERAVDLGIRTYFRNRQREAVAIDQAMGLRETLWERGCIAAVRSHVVSTGGDFETWMQQIIWLECHHLALRMRLRWKLFRDRPEYEIDIIARNQFFSALSRTSALSDLALLRNTLCASDLAMLNRYVDAGSVQRLAQTLRAEDGNRKPVATYRLAIDGVLERVRTVLGRN